MFCPYCGKEIPDGAKFCGVCGQKIRPAGMQPRNTQQNSERQPDSSKKKLIILGIIAGVLVLAAVLVVVLFAVPSKADSYQKQIDLGEQYLAAEDYEQAIVAYTAAIEIDAQQTDAYMARAEAYIALALEEDAGGAGEEAEADAAAESADGAGEDDTETDAENADGDTQGDAEEGTGGDAAEDAGETTGGNAEDGEEDAEDSGGEAGEADGEEDAGEADGGEAEDTAEDTVNTAAEENLDRALADYRTVIGLEPERTQAYIRAADIYTVYRADYESAEEILEEGLAANPDDEDLADALEEVEEMIEEAEEAAEAAEAVNIFSVIPDEFTFSSGAGAWATELYLNDDGTFTGKYFDDDMGDTGTNYPNGTEYLCNFSGSFGEAEQIDEYTWSVKLLSLETEGTPGEVYYEDGVRYILSMPYGLDDADTFMIYLPGKPYSEIPQEFMDWAFLSSSNEVRSTLPDGFYGLYNVSGEEGFTATSDDYFWWNSYTYEYEDGYSYLSVSAYEYTSVSFFTDEATGSVLRLGFAWSDLEQTSFTAYLDEDYDDYGDTPAFTVDISLSDDRKSMQVTITSLTGEDLSRYGGSADGVLSATYLLEE